jgi:thiamine biosynthesis lipoprotein ApbE
MFEAGGDMVFGDPPPGEAGWLVQPQADGLPELRLANCAAAISGNTVQFIEIDSKRYGHIIDPRTGKPIRTDRVCLVTAPTGLDADPLATLGTFMPPDEFKALIDQHYPQANTWTVDPTTPDQPEHPEPHP